jgi:hypothetical protein
MTTKNSRILCIPIIAGIPFLIAGLFVYRNTFPEAGPMFGAPVHLARDVFFASSIPPTLFSLAVSMLFQAPLFFILRRDPILRKTKLVLILTGIALIPVLWATIVVTETLVRSRYFALWDMYIIGFPPMSTSSIVIGVVSSIVILFLGIHPAMNKNAV